MVLSSLIRIFPGLISLCIKLNEFKWFTDYNNWIKNYCGDIFNGILIILPKSKGNAITKQTYSSNIYYGKISNISIIFGCGVIFLYALTSRRAV
jgi:hypothetical protein